MKYDLKLTGFIIKLVVILLGLVTALAASFAWGALSYPIFGWKAKVVSIFAKNEKNPIYAVSEHKPFVIIVPSFNNTEWVNKNLTSIFEQKYDNYRVIYINDASSDGTLEKVNEFLLAHQMSHRIEIIHNEKNK